MDPDSKELAELLAAIDLAGGPGGLTRAQVEAAPARLRPLLERLRTLHEERLFLEQIVENIPDMIFVKEAADLRFVRFNKAGEELLGYARADLLGKNDRDFFPPEEAAFFIAKDREVLAEGRLVDIPEEPIHTRLRGARWLHTKKIPIRDADGRPLYLLGISEDVTERKLAREELAAANERLAAERMQARLLETQKLEGLGLMAGGIAHDFNNLLVAILGNASLALSDLAADHPARSAVETIEHAARAASELTHQLLAYSGKGRFVVEPVDVTELVRDAASLLDVTLLRRGELRLELALSLPPVEADAAQLRQLVMNLVANAADAIEGRPGGSVVVRTGVADLQADDPRCGADEGLLAPGPHVVLEVVDDGAGMDEATRKRMFDPFFTTKERGHGLGLAAALGIVRGHRGRIEVESAPGAGTTVTVLIPPTPRPRAARAAEPPPGVPELTGRKVLVVDDAPFVREFVARVLRRAGMEVVLAADGSEGLARFGPDIDLVILDLTMPGMSGHEVLAELRRVNPSVPVVLSSGFDETEAREGFPNGAGNAFLQKPHGPAELLAKVEECLARGR